MIWTPETIRALRSRAGWTQVRLAHALGASEQAVLKWEAGTRSPDPRHAKRLNAIARALDDREDDAWMVNGGYDRDGDFVGFRFKRTGDRVLMQMGTAVEGLFIPAAEALSFVSIIQTMLRDGLEPAIAVAEWTHVLSAESDE